MSFRAKNQFSRLTAVVLLPVLLLFSSCANEVEYSLHGKKKGGQEIGDIAEHLEEVATKDCSKLSGAAKQCCEKAGGPLAGFAALGCIFAVAAVIYAEEEDEGLIHILF